MMYSLGVLIAAALILGCHSVRVHQERVVHGRQLKIYLPKNADQLDFSQDSSFANPVALWHKGRLSANIGRVAGSGNDRRWYLEKVIYANEGRYVLKDWRGTELSMIDVSVVARTNNVKCVAGENLRISLEGISSQDAALVLSGNTENRTLVYRGQPSSQDVSSWGRLEITSTNIVIKHVNYTDEGLYFLKDYSNRVVSFTKMELVEAHEYSDGNPLLALLLLLGIPAGICCCCRKKIFKKKATNATMLQTTPHVVHTPPAIGPTGPCPPYATPGQPGPVYHQGYNPNMNPGVQPPPGGVAGPGQWTGPPPAAGFNPVYPPLNPVYPPPGPAMVPPAQPPQWNGPPAGPYPPGPEAPMGYAPAPAMYTAPPPTSEQAKVPPSAADPLLYPAAPAPAPAPSADGTYTFKIDGAQTSSNFL
ncbi:uncharacterized protein LOC142903261 [Nelusetta ayraudi]|uniref:uncharacterized protein LOC142903261 n=1 Tax=Nelusetta ayraudi TaxID=303726 RepID=UPI003F71E692